MLKLIFFICNTFFLYFEYNHRLSPKSLVFPTASPSNEFISVYFFQLRQLRKHPKNARLRGSPLIPKYILICLVCILIRRVSRVLVRVNLRYLELYFCLTKSTLKRGFNIATSVQFKYKII